MIIGRGKRWNLDLTDGTYTYTAHMGSVNYQDEYETWQPINCELAASAEPEWDYEVVENYWHFYVNNDGTIKGIKTEDSTGVTWRPTGIGYYNSAMDTMQPLIDFSYGTPTVENNRISWEVYSGITVECIITPDRMRTNILLTQAVRDALPDPSVYGIDAASCETVVIYEVDWTDTNTLQDANSDEINTSDHAEAGTVIVTNSGDQATLRLPRLAAFVDIMSPVPILRRFAGDYIYETIPYNDMQGLADGTLTFDDSVEYTGAGDGMVTRSGSDWETVHDSAAGLSAVPQTNNVGMYYSDPSYGIYRLFMYFDTSGLDDGATITAADLELCCESDNSTTDFNVTVVEGTQGTTLETTDYSEYNLTELTNAPWNSSNYDDENYITISLNAAGLALINKSGNTYYCIISQEDLNDSPPTDSEWVRFRASDDTDQEPKLEITYDLSSSSSSSSSQSTSFSSSSSSESQSFSSSSSSSSESQSLSSSSSSLSSWSSESSSCSSSSESVSFSSSSSSSSESESQSSSSSSSSESESSSSSSFSSSSQSSSSSSQSSSSSSFSSSSSSSSSLLYRDISVKFVYNSTELDFYTDETIAVRLRRCQDVDRFWKQTGYVHQYKVGLEHDEIDIALDLIKSDVISRAETLWNQVDSYYQPSVLRCYYKYNIDMTAYVDVQMDREAFRKQYYAGYSRKAELELKFIETQQT